MLHVRTTYQYEGMNDAPRRVSPGIALLLLLAVVGDVRAQTVDLGGRAFIDYFYHVTSPDEASEGLHGFRYRRLYLTADARLSDDFRSRARLEANDGTTGAKGPVPFVKDLWVEWSYSGSHTATLGVLKPPVYDLAEDVWGYRSLEKMMLDFQGVNSSRDFGIRFDGAVASGGAIRYAIMLANNSAAMPETDVYKRGYAMLSFHPDDEMVFYASADRAGYGDEREAGTRVSAFGGYDGEQARFGVEAFWSELEFVDAEAFSNRGVSLFATYRISPRLELLARTDFTREGRAATIAETFVVAGVTYVPGDYVRIIPNLWIFNSEAVGDPDVMGRLTVDLSF